MRRTLIVATAVLGLLVYTCDYLCVRYRIPKNRDPLGAVQVERYYAIPLKGGKIEYTAEEPETVTCVRSLFPHFGYAPCWYLNRNKEKRIAM
jgi:hypothetical protein